ncbi:MAG: hypothetical protein U0531_06395 [Dehalococcoidia bacterium]
MSIDIRRPPAAAGTRLRRPVRAGGEAGDPAPGPPGRGAVHSVIASGGVMCAEDAIEYLMAGASAVQVGRHLHQPARAARRARRAGALAGGRGGGRPARGHRRRPHQSPARPPGGPSRPCSTAPAPPTA